MELSCDGHTITRQVTNSESELAETRHPDVSVERTDKTKQDIRSKYTSSTPVESGSQSGVAGGQATSSNSTGVNNGHMATSTSNVSFNFNFCPYSSAVYSQHRKDIVSLQGNDIHTPQESTRRDGPSSSSIRNEATREETGGLRQDAKMEPQVPDVIEGMSGLSVWSTGDTSRQEEISLRIPKQIPPVSHCLEIELTGVKLRLRLRTKHNIEYVVIIAETDPSQVDHVYVFLDDICSKIECSDDVHPDPEKAVPCVQTIQPTSVFVNLSKIEKEIIRVLTRQNVERILYIAIYSSKDTDNISKFLFSVIKKIASQGGNQIQRTANSEETFRGANLEKEESLHRNT